MELFISISTLSTILFVSFWKNWFRYLSRQKQTIALKMLSYFQFHFRPITESSQTSLIFVSATIVGCFSALRRGQKQIITLAATATLMIMLWVHFWFTNSIQTTIPLKFFTILVIIAMGISDESLWKIVNLPNSNYISGSHTYLM